MLEGFEAAEHPKDGDERFEAGSVRVVLEPGDRPSREAGSFSEIALGEVLGETFGTASLSEFVDHLIVGQHEPRHDINVSHMSY